MQLDPHQKNNLNIIFKYSQNQSCNSPHSTLFHLMNPQVSKMTVTHNQLMNLRDNPWISKLIGSQHLFPAQEMIKINHSFTIWPNISSTQSSKWWANASNKLELQLSPKISSNKFGLDLLAKSIQPNRYLKPCLMMKKV